MKSLILFTMFLYASSSLAVANGTIAGTIFGMDNRGDPYGGAAVSTGKRFDATQLYRVDVNTARSVPLKNARIRVWICNFGGACMYKDTYTGSNGTYAVNWSDISPYGFTIQVMAERRKVDSNDTWIDNSLAVVTAADEAAVMLAEHVLGPWQQPAPAQVVFNATVPSSEALGVYLTAQEAVSMVQMEYLVGAGGDTSQATMKQLAHHSFQNLDLIINDTLIAPTNGATAATDERIYLSPNRGPLPRNVIHEMGHIVMWRAHDDDIAPIIPWLDYNCDGVLSPSWTRTSIECERAAAMDGFADFFVAVYLWDPLHQTVSNATLTTFAPIIQLQFSDVRCPSFFVAPVSTNHNMAMCNTRGFYKIFSTTSLGTVINTLMSYPANCNDLDDNHCGDERFMFQLVPLGVTVDLNAQNWADFAYNYQIYTGLSPYALTRWAGLQGSEP
jgi:hypothetical protein